MRTFFTADTHFGHRGIIEHCNRPFHDVDAMDEALIELWNSTVTSNDSVWHLGDFAWENHEKYLDSLNGHIHLIRGNHDNFSAQVRSRFARVSDLFAGHVCSGSRHFFLFHYPMVSWPKKHLGESIHLYGHVHGRYSRNGEASLDVGVDCHNFQPVLMEEVVTKALEKLSNAQQEHSIERLEALTPLLSEASEQSDVPGRR